MEEVKRQAPGDEERFYRIQNRQQLLARDILRDKYGITIPEPQMTGTSMLQDAKQTKKQRSQTQANAFKVVSYEFRGQSKQG
ncbi:MAG: hypothetical protein ACLR8Y_10725 [Alistipes indistinctus]